MYTMSISCTTIILGNVHNMNSVFISFVFTAYSLIVLFWLGLAWKPLALAWPEVALASQYARPSHRRWLWLGFGLAWSGPGFWKRNMLNNQGVAKMGNSYHRTKWNWCKVSGKYGLYLYVISLDYAHEARNPAGNQTMKHGT